jgi:hypothetical protein
MSIFTSGTNPLVSEIFADVRALLHDDDKIRYDDAFLLLAVNAGELEIVTLRPDAGANLDVIQLDPGCWQEIDGFVLMEVLENLGTDGATPGRTPTRLSKQQMQSLFPDMHNTAIHPASATVLAWAYDTRDQTRFLVYPPQPAQDTGYLRLKQSSLPPGVTAPTDPIYLTLDFKPALVEYCLYHCFKRDAEYADYAQRAAAHYQQFQNLLGISGEAAVQIADRAQGEN